MKIGELAKAAGVATSRIRFYEKHGLMPQTVRQENGYRDYPEAMISRLHTITMSKALGFSLAEIKRFLPDDPSDVMERAEVISNLEAKLQDIEQRIKDLKSMRKNVKDMVVYLKDPNSKAC
ncbi:MerR family transcriptional regulator [Roseibium sp. MMSF_3412]|uniref:MerR family transcriptional regulator n=1 Tax=Roseibium sp. MMSF_3412 TaxID=3046712 RepID=UPI00273F07C0|nr:MerR family transcriptional regulator [Roseibium sp. MMSF_3412]